MLLDTPQVSRIAFRDGGDRSGIVVREDGRVCLISQGVGLSVQLDPVRLHELGRQMIAVAALVEDRHAAAAAAADEDLLRAVSRAGSPGADDDA
jgi:hypothetical protein